MALIRFEKADTPQTGITFSRNPARGGYSRKLQPRQVSGYSGDGTAYIYTKAATPLLTIELSWENLPIEDIEYLKAFVADIDGSATSFLFYDIDARVYNARLLPGSEVSTAPVAFGRESLQLQLLIEGEVTA